MGQLSALDALEAEYEENVRRVDLTWQEHALATKKLHDLRSAQAASRGEEQKISDTAKEIEGRSDGEYLDKTRRSIILASHLENPDVAKAKDSKEAFKILKRVEEAERNVQLADRVGKTFSAADHTLLLGDCLKWMYELPPSSFDVIITDPPYGMGADSFGDGAGKLTGITHEYKDDEESFKQLLSEAIGAFGVVAKSEAHLYICCDFDKFHWLKMMLNAQGWTVFRTPLINVKVGSGRVPLPEHGPRRTYEIILYAFRGGKRVTAIYPDVFSTEAEDNLGHGAQKPTGMYADLLKRSARPGDRVLDPFAGTGSIFPAAHEAKVAATGIELSPQYYGIAARRLESLK
jgi:DNA modification methylase